MGDEGAGKEGPDPAGLVAKIPEGDGELWKGFSSGETSLDAHLI